MWCRARRILQLQNKSLVTWILVWRYILIYSLYAGYTASEKKNRHIINATAI